MPALHIAVLDDEVDITQLLASYLRGQGFRVTPVHSGRSLMGTYSRGAPTRRRRAERRDQVKSENVVKGDRLTSYPQEAVAGSRLGAGTLWSQAATA